MVRLSLLEVSDCRVPECLIYRGGGWRWVRQPILVGWLRHPRRGAFLIDCGTAPRIRHGWGRLFWWVAQIRQHVDLKLAIPHAPQGIILTHLHLDHVGGWRDFPSTPTWLSSLAFEHVAGLWAPERLRFGYRADLLNPGPLACWSWLENHPLNRLLPCNLQGRDLFGDDSVLAVPLPGHAAGHHGLWIKTAKGPVFLVGDAIGHSQMLDASHPAMLPRLFANDRSLEANTARQLQELARSHPEVLQVPSHCPLAWKTALLSGHLDPWPTSAES